MNDTCAKEGCDNPSYTKSCIILGSLIGKVEVYLCTKHLARLIQVKNVFKEEQNEKASQEA